MSSVGRTSWWPCDAAEHDRELNVELGDEFGPGGPYTMRVLKDLAQAQRSDGRVRTGFRILAKKTAIRDLDEQRRVVEYAAEIGALDDLEIDGDGRRFTCRVSGWEADQARGREAIKKALQRNGDKSPSQGDMSPANGTRGTVVPLKGDNATDDGDFVPSGGDMSTECPPTREVEEEENELNPPTPKGGNRQRDKLQFDEAVQAYTVALGIEHEDGWQNVKAAIGLGASTNDEVLAWLRKWRPDVLPTESAA